MNLLEAIKRILGYQDWKKASNLLGWRARPTQQKKSRKPFAGRERKIAPSRMTIEEFDSKANRNERFRQLREKQTPGLCKFSTVRNNKSVWCVARGQHA